MVITALQHLRTCKDSTGAAVCQVFHLAQDHLLYVRWLRDCPEPEAFRSAWLSWLRAADQTRARALLHDCRQQLQPWPWVHNWLTTAWLPLALASPLRRMAHLDSAMPLARAHAGSVLPRWDARFPVLRFSSEGAARGWLHLAAQLYDQA